MIRQHLQRKCRVSWRFYLWLHYYKMEMTIVGTMCIGWVRDVCFAGHELAEGGFDCHGIDLK